MTEDLKDARYTTTDIAKIFAMPAAAARARLDDAPVADMRNGSKRYRIREAAPYLVDPSEDIETVIKGMRPDDLPVRLHDSFWGGQLKRQKYKTAAEDLWLTEDVEKAFGEVFMLFRESVALWTETVERNAIVTDPHRVELVKLSDDLMQSFHEKITAMLDKTDNSWDAEIKEDAKRDTKDAT